MDDKKPCIFLVDDNILSLSSNKAALQDKYTVVTIPSGEKLFSSIKKLKPDLILMDVVMPGMSGYDAIRGLKLNPVSADIPVIFLTSKDNSDDEIAGLTLGAVDFIGKPCPTPILQKRVELQLNLQEQKGSLREYSSSLLNMVSDRANDIAALQNAIIMWAAEIIEFRDEETGHHVERVQKYLTILLNEMEKSDKYMMEIAGWDIDAFIRSALLHDVGKIKIHDDILLKKDRLSEEEFKNMQRHAQYGKALLEKLQEKVPDQTFVEYAKTLAYRHHERWDGAGYPDHLKGEEIPLQARMMALADVYDALVSERQYKKAYPHQIAMKFIEEGRGHQFDPNLTDLFLDSSDRIKVISDEIKKEEHITEKSEGG